VRAFQARIVVWCADIRGRRCACPRLLSFSLSGCPIAFRLRHRVQAVPSAFRLCHRVQAVPSRSGCAIVWCGRRLPLVRKPPGRSRTPPSDAVFYALFNAARAIYTREVPRPTSAERDGRLRNARQVRVRRIGFVDVIRSTRRPGTAVGTGRSQCAQEVVPGVGHHGPGMDALGRAAGDASPPPLKR